MHLDKIRVVLTAIEIDLPQTVDVGAGIVHRILPLIIEFVVRDATTRCLGRDEFYCILEFASVVTAFDVEPVIPALAIRMPREQRAAPDLTKRQTRKFDPAANSSRPPTSRVRTWQRESSRPFF